MRVSCLQEHLAHGLGVVSRAVAPRSTLPVLGHVALTATAVTAQVHRAGTTTVPARLLGDLVGVLPSDRIDLALDEETETLTVQCARYTTHIKGLPASAFPLVPTAEGRPALQVDPALLRAMIPQVTFAAAADEARPILTGVLVTLADDTLTLATADGFRLAVRDARFEMAAATDLQAVVPASALNELARTLGGAEGADPVPVWLTRSQVVFRAGPTELVSALIEGQFPDHQRIVPTGYTIRAQMSRGHLLQAARVAALFAPENQGTVILTLEPGADLLPGRVVLSAGADQVGDNQNQVEALIAGTNGSRPARVGFNARYLIQMLGVVKAEEVALEMTTPTAPGWPSKPWARMAFSTSSCPCNWPGRGRGGRRVTLTLRPQDRPRHRLREIGAPYLSAPELLATVLTGMWAGDAVELGYRLMARFGSLERLAQASLGELCQVPGVGHTCRAQREARACQILAALDLGRRRQTDGQEEQPVIRCPANAARLLQPHADLANQMG